MAVSVVLCVKPPRGGRGFVAGAQGGAMPWCAACFLGNLRIAQLAEDLSEGKVGHRVEVG